MQGAAKERAVAAATAAQHEPIDLTIDEDEEAQGDSKPAFSEWGQLSIDFAANAALDAMRLCPRYRFG